MARDILIGEHRNWLRWAHAYCRMGRLAATSGGQGFYNRGLAFYALMRAAQVRQKLAAQRKTGG